MKRSIWFVASLLTMLMSVSTFAANVTKVVITAVEPVVGEVRSFKARVPETASTEIYEVHWSGEFNNGVFVQGRDYTMTVKLRIKASSSNIFATSSNINATINGHKARVSKNSEKYITVRYTWKTLGGENPDDPQYKLKTKLKELAAAYSATNASDDKELLAYLRRQLPTAEIWSTGGSYKYTRKIPSETKDGNVSVPIGITYEGVTLKNHNFTVVLPALNKSPEAAKLRADMELMKAALRNLPVSAETTGEEVLAAVNAAAVNGTKAVWDVNYRYNAPKANLQGSIDGNLIFALGNTKDIFHAHKTLPIAGDQTDTAIDADFSALSKTLHNHAVNNRTTQEELEALAHAAMKNGSQLTVVGFTKTKASYENEGKIVMWFEMELKGKTRSPRIAMRFSKLRPELPTEISLTQDEWEVLRLTNIERYKAGRTLLAMIAPLQNSTDIREKEIVSDYRLDHKRPDGSSCFTSIDPSFMRNRTGGENCQQNAFKPSQAIDSWMRSPGHKANMLKASHCYFGAGVHAVGSMKYWVQHFAGGNDIYSAETSTGSTHFATIDDMKAAYLICKTGTGYHAYVPLDADYMDRDGNKYTLHLQGFSVSVTVDKPDSGN